MDLIKNVIGTKKSSRRIAGLACIGVGLIISLLAVLLGIEADLTSTILTHVFSAGTVLLGITTADYFSPRKGNTHSYNGVGYKKEQ